MRTRFRNPRSTTNHVVLSIREYTALYTETARKNGDLRQRRFQNFTGFQEIPTSERDF